MVRGIGVDTVSIPEMGRYLSLASQEAFVLGTFSSMESAQATKVPNTAEYFATRFAAKEAVYKAIAHLTPKKAFDLRIIETLNDVDGCPYISINEPLQAILLQANISTIHISITTEGEYATAFVVACG